jgi:glycosyltransferase involved in cell wall biosynthesis
MAMIEALSCGLPVVVPDEADFREVASDGDNALLAKDHQVTTFARLVCRLLEDATLYEQLRNGALATAEQYRDEYSLEYQTALWQRELSKAISY